MNSLALEDSTNIQNVSSVELHIHVNSSTPIQNTTNKKIDKFRIIKNMEEVLKSVKKEEHKKHHRNKHNKNKKICSKLLSNLNTHEIADISNKLESTSTSPNLMKIKVANSTEKLNSIENRLDMKEKRKKKSKNESSSNHKIISEHSEAMNSSFTSPKKLITGHFLLTPKKQAITENSLEAKTSDFANDSALDNLNTTKMNAFEFLMNSRNKSIGRNSPGKECIGNEGDYDHSEYTEEKKVDKTKRKNLLQDLVESKSKNKRKFVDLDQSRGEYIEQQLNKRAKRLKLMLTEPEKKGVSSSPEKIENEKPAKEIKIAKRRLKQSNIVHLSSSEVFNEKLRVEDVAFVSKLSSPIKKKDNLLGYFSKTISPILLNNETAFCASEEVQIEQNTPRRRGRPKRIESATLKKDTNNLSSSAPLEQIQNSEQMSTPTHRPRRTCVGKARYDYDLEVSPTKSKPPKKNRIEISKEDVIVLDTSDTLNPNEIEPRKLAPLFIKSIPKPCVDPNIVRARQEFLMSGVPDKMKKEMAKQKTFDENFEAAISIFPIISHVPSWQIENIKVLNEQICKIKWRNEHNFNIGTTNCTKRLSKSNNLRTSIWGDFLNNSKLLPIKFVETFDNKKQVVKTLKSLYEKFPTYKCYNQLRKKYHFFISSDTGEDHQQVTESFMVTRRSNKNSSVSADIEDDVKPPPSAPNGELLFTEKYKALSSDQIFVNVSPVNALKEFLAAWQNVNKFSKDENVFEDSNSIGTSVNSIVLVGPKSSGKTSAVFALANEMNFQILEINAGMKRTGKKLLQDLQEATQSHQVRKESNLMKKSLEKPKLNKRTSNENSDSLVDFSSEKMSLVLLEDADIIFEQHDFGFVDAIYQLTATSKRPVVITSNDYNCQHLNRLINDNSVYFPAPNPQNISKFISILALIENCPIALNEILSLYLYNSMDLRKTILEMQFFVQSGGGRVALNNQSSNINSFYADSLSEPNSLSLGKENLEKSVEDYMHCGLFNFYVKSQNVEFRIPIPINYNVLRNNLSNIFDLSKNLKVKDNSQCEKSCSGEILENLVDFYENISTANYLDKTTDFTDRLKLNIGEEISYYLVDNALRENLNAENCSLNLYDEPPQERISLTSSMFSSGIIHKNKSIALDYEPYLRGICRSEKERLLHDRRGSRFYHYLRNCQTNSFSAKKFDESCEIFLGFNSLNQS